MKKIAKSKMSRDNNLYDHQDYFTDSSESESTTSKTSETSDTQTSTDSQSKTKESTTETSTTETSSSEEELKFKRVTAKPSNYVSKPNPRKLSNSARHIKDNTVPSKNISSDKYELDMTSKVVHIETEEEYNMIFKKLPNKLIIVDFSATWCGPCRSIEPKYNELSKKYPKSIFLHVDIDKLENMPIVQDISNVLTFKLFKNGDVVGKMSGANVTRLEELIKKHSV